MLKPGTPNRRLLSTCRPPFRARSRAGWQTFTLLLAVHLAAVAAWAQEPTPGADAEPRLFIETIVIEKSKKFPSNIVLAESLLEEGASYTEAELRDAVKRIVRMPLILDADYSLSDGSQPGRHELVITVTEARRWFFGVENVVTDRGEPVSINGLETTDVTVGSVTLAGYRVPVGGEGIFFVTAGGADGGFQLGYAHNNLFQRSILLSFKAALTECAEVHSGNEDYELGEDGCATEVLSLGLDPTFSSWSLVGDQVRFRLNLGVPIRGNHSFRLLTSLRKVYDGFRRPTFDPQPQEAVFVSDRVDLEIRPSWIYNSVDDSTLPTSGAFMEGGLRFQALNGDLLGPATPGLTEYTSNELRAVGSYMRYWPVGRSDTVGLLARAHVGVAEVENLPLLGQGLVSDELNTWGGAVRLFHGHFLQRVHNGAPRRPKQRPRWREWRWENEIEISRASTHPDFNQAYNPVTSFRIGSGIVFRNTWGVFRLKLNYEDVDGS